MTCIVGIEDNGVVYIGGDSAAVGGLDITIMSEPKVFRNGEMVIGYTSSFRMGQLLQYALRIPDNEGFEDVHYLVSVFIPAVRECLRAGGYTTINNNEETGGVFLLGYRGKLYKVGSDFQICRSADGYNACGCGESYALGAMRLLKNGVYGLNAGSIETILGIAAHFSAGVRPPFTVVSGVI